MTEATTTSEPQLILGKFKDQAALAEAYQQLERKMGERTNPGLPGSQPRAEPQVGETDGTSAQAKANAKVQEALQALLAGDPKAEGLLVSLGTPPETARIALGVAHASQERYVNQVYKAAGGTKEAYGQLLEWANQSENVTDFERESFMADIESGNPSRVLVAVRTLRERHLQDTGFDPQQLVVAVPGGPAEKVQPFATDVELGKAFADPRYNVDAAYTAKVQARARVSNVEARTFQKDE